MPKKMSLTAHVDTQKFHTRIEIRLAGTTLVASLDWRGRHPMTAKVAMEYFDRHPTYFKREEGWETCNAIGYLPAKVAS